MTKEEMVTEIESILDAFEKRLSSQIADAESCEFEQKIFTRLLEIVLSS